MFAFVVRRLGWLARVPLAPQVFDAFLVAGTALFHRRRLAAMEALEMEVRGWPGMERFPHRFGGLEFRLAGQEIGHLHGNGLLDVRLDRERAARAIQAGAAVPHHVFGPSAWVSFWLRDPSDLPAALRLLREAADRGSGVPAIGSTGPADNRAFAASGSQPPARRRDGTIVQPGHWRADRQETPEKPGRVPFSWKSPEGGSRRGGPAGAG